MTKRITLVIDVPDDREADHVKTVWKVDRLASELGTVDNNVQASVFVGKLEDAPDSWGYLLFTDNESLPDRTAVPAFKDRLARTIGAEKQLIVAAQIAEAHGMIGALDIVSAMGGDKANFLNVRSNLAKQLGWHVTPVTDVYSRTTNEMKLSLAKMIVTYLSAALG